MRKYEKIQDLKRWKIVKNTTNSMPVQDIITKIDKTN